MTDSYGKPPLIKRLKDSEIELLLELLRRGAHNQQIMLVDGEDGDGHSLSEGNSFIVDDMVSCDTGENLPPQVYIDFSGEPRSPF